MSIKLQQKDKLLWGRTIHLPYEIGEAKIGEDGFIEVATIAQAEGLAGANLGYEIVEELPRKAEVDTLGEKGENKDDIGNKDTEKDNDLLKAIDAMNIEDLRKQAATFPEEEWKAMNKKDLKEYLKGKLLS